MIMTSWEQLYILEETDIDRLHDVIDGRVGGRACGNTFATLMLMLGEAQLGDSFNKYLYVGENAVIVKSIMRTFAHILEHEGFKVTQHGTHSLYVSENDTTSRVMSFMFMSVTNDIDIKVAGMEFNRIFVDVSDWKRMEYKDHIDTVLTRERNT